MIQGIEVLNQTEIVNSGYIIPEWLLVIGVLIIIIGVAVIGYIPSTKYLGEIYLIGIIPTLICIVALSVVFVGCVSYSEKTGRFEYQVIVSNDVNFSEFSDKYEIIKQEGKIYTIVEKQ